MPDLSLRGQRLHYRDEGRGDALVLLHGLGNSSRDWEFIRDELLGAGYRLICPDFLGFGQSTVPEQGYSPEDMARDVLALLDHLHLKDVHLVGYSMGGAVAYQLALDAPERLLSLSIISSLPCFVPQRMYDHWQFWLRHVLSRVLGMQKMAERVTQNMFGHRPELAAIMLPRYANNDRVVYSKVLGALSGWDVRERLDELRCPVLILAAEFDYFRLEDIEQSAALIPHAELQLVPDTRHGLPMEAPELVAQALLSFISSSRRASSARA